MFQNIQIMDRIRSCYSSLRPSEKRVADYILTHPDLCTKATITSLADLTGVSQPTVIRFTRALGFDGYRSFHHALIKSSRETNPVSFQHLGGFNLMPWEILEDLPLKETQYSSSLLVETLKALEPRELDHAVTILSNARTVDIYSVENSRTPASDLLTKLTYLGINCKMHTDTYLQQISAVHLSPEDTAVAFSHSGASIDTVKAFKQARKAGARTIAITGTKTQKLTQLSDVCLYTGETENTIYGNAIFSRIPDLAVVDLLYMGIILSDYERFSENLDKSGAVIADRGYSDQ